MFEFEILVMLAKINHNLWRIARAIEKTDSKQLDKLTTQITKNADKLQKAVSKNTPKV